MSAKHTPGPYSAEGPDMFGDYNIFHPADALAVAAVVSNMRPADEVAANAALFSAAPDLLESARGLVRMVEAMRYSTALGKTQIERLERAKAAIAKATSSCGENG